MTFNPALSSRLDHPRRAGSMNAVCVSPYLKYRVAISLNCLMSSNQFSILCRIR